MKKKRKLSRGRVPMSELTEHGQRITLCLDALGKSLKWLESATGRGGGTMSPLIRRVAMLSDVRAFEIANALSDEAKAQGLFGDIKPAWLKYGRFSFEGSGAPSWLDGIKPEKPGRKNRQRSPAKDQAARERDQFNLVAAQVVELVDQVSSLELRVENLRGRDSVVESLLAALTRKVKDLTARADSAEHSTRVIAKTVESQTEELERIRAVAAGLARRVIALEPPDVAPKSTGKGRASIRTPRKKKGRRSSVKSS